MSKDTYAEDFKANAHAANAAEAAEQCYKCQGEGGELQIEGPHQVFMPCFRCGSTGRLPAGSQAADAAAKCPACAGAGGEMVTHPEDAQCDGWYNCGACKGTGRKEA